MEMVALNRIEFGGNVRAVPPSAAAEEGMRLSVAALGVLQAVLLRRMPPDRAHNGHNLQIVLGCRRFRAAQDVGLLEIPADIRDMSDAEVEQARLAENMVREAMHPIDEWRGVRGLIQDHGLTFEQAAGALGLDERATRRMEMLSRLDPAFLALCEIEMPKPGQLRVIAAAPAKLQASVAKGKDLRSARGDAETVHWHWDDIAARCAVVRIPRARAIFDLEKAKGLVWDEDLFAQPGAEDQFTTADVNRFMELQAAALTAKVEALVKAKKRHQVTTMAANGWEVKLPSGFVRVYNGNPDKLRRHETAFHVLNRHGSIEVAFGQDTKAARAAEAVKPKATAEGVGSDADDADAGDDDDGIEGAPEPAVKPPFTKAGMAMIAAAKTAALRKTLEEGIIPHTADVTALLVLALCAENVSVRAANGGFKDLAAKLLTPGGDRLELNSYAWQIGRTAIARILNCDEVTSRFTNVGSGAAAEWVGAAIAAADALERFDTEEFLATANNAELKRAAADAGLLTGGTGAQLRERLVGRAPNYRPETAVFGAPAPKPRRRDDD